MNFDFENLQQIIKEEREKQNLSLEDISKKIKVPLYVLKELETDPSFFNKNYPYSFYVVREILNLLKIEDLDFNLAEEEEKKQNKQLKKENGSFLSNLKNKIISMFKLLFLSFSLFTFFFLNYSFQKQKEEKKEIPLIEYNEKINKDFSINQKKLENIHKLQLIAKKDIWLSAIVDGKQHIFNLKKNNKLDISFKEKIYFETIGNADGLIIKVNNKNIKLTENDIIHNIFVDKSGIFKNGYNLLKENS
ncbi:helix-turn-helix domain-containing protein [Hydrogenothermus marinus]|uniref:Helix-turn-helix protein n=1 Tax=Hydrogenothermus marinus TaxID=133270 RepID=A0A3M0B613_9AQUI|nr:helix-turn-helix domain-containing protein [Hydrogenothermus marinus]RMA92487.1 helix-turn-helix protein [Hydrogenothermus marinus]